MAIGRTLTPAETAELARATKNPFELARFIDKHPAGYWDFEWKSPTLSVKADRQGFCTTQVLSVMVPEQAIVIIECHRSPGDHYIRYTRRSDGSWRCEGSQDFFIHHWPRRHEVERDNGELFLRVSRQGDYGTGLSVEIEEWFDLTRPGFEPVFEFPVQGHYNQPQLMGTEFTAHLIVNPAELVVMLFVTFETDASQEHVTELGKRELTAKYARNRKGEFRCASVTDGASCTDFEALSTSGGPSEEDLVRLSFDVLKNVATGRDANQKRWLRAYLAQRKNTPEVRELRALLK
jgi:hypothetical protein